MNVRQWRTSSPWKSPDLRDYNLGAIRSEILAMAPRTGKSRKQPKATGAAGSKPITASYDSTGAAGADFEIDVVVQLLGALLAEAGDRLLPSGWMPRWVRVQRRDGPRGFDDVTVDAGPREAPGTPVYLQVKRTFSLTAEAGELKDYVESVRARDAEDPAAPWFAVIVAGKLTPALADVQALTEWARSAQSESDFASKCQAPGVLNAAKRAVLAAVTAHLQGHAEPSAWRVLRRLRAAEVDYANENSRDAEQLRDRLGPLLTPGARSAEDLRQALRGRVLREARYSPTYTRASLLAELDAAFSFVALPRLAPDLDRLHREAALSLRSIDTGVAGVSLLRPALYGEAQEALAHARPLRLTGEAGSGKSMILARLAASAPRRLVLKDDRISGRTWPEYGGKLGLTLTPDTILAVLGDRPGAVLAIDGADRLLMSERRGVVLDLLRALAVSPMRANWRLVTSGRDVQTRDLVRDALLDLGMEPGQRVDVGELDDEDAAFLADHVPALRSLVLRTDLGGRNRDLFTLREAWLDPGAGAVGSEVGLAARWATRGERATPPAPARDMAIAQIGAQLVASPGALIGRADVASDGVSILLQENSLHAAAHRDALLLAHDIYEDWAVARTLDRRRAELPDLLRAADQPLWWLRAVRLAGQIVLEVSGPTAWLALVKACFDAADLDPVWWRTLLVAPLYSERVLELLTAASPLLLAEDGEWLERLVDSLQILESRPDEDIFARAEGTQEERQRIAALFPVPNGRSWRAFFRWAADGWSAWPGRLVPKLVQMSHTWLRASEGWRHLTAQKLVAAAFDWLVEIEDADTFVRWEERRPPFGCEAHDHGLWEKTAGLLREGMAYGVLSSPAVVEAYLERATSKSGRGREYEELLKLPRAIPSQLPTAWANFCIARFAPKRPRVRHEHFFGHFNALDFNGGGLRSLSISTASPRYAGFDQLFEVAPVEALRMLRKFEKRASVFYRHYVRQNDGRRPRPVRVQLPWGEVPLWGDENTYRWARGTLGPDVLGSAYMALDLWMGRQAAAGRPLDELFRLVLRPHGLNATLCPCVNVAVEHINTPGQIDAVEPILAEPRVWNFDVRRFTDDLTFARQPLVPYYAAAHRPAVLEVGARYAGRQHLRADLTLPFLLMAGEAAQSALEARVQAWTAADMACFDDELQNPLQVAEFERQLERYRSDLDRSNVKFEAVDGQIQVSIAPPAAIAEEIAGLDTQHAAFQAGSRLMLWGVKSLEENAFQASMDVEAAIEAARAYDAPALLSAYSQERFNDYLAAQGFAATAAAVARLAPDAVLERHRDWVTKTLIAAAQVKRDGQMFDVDEAHLAGDPAASAAQGLGALVVRGGDRAIVGSHLLTLATDRHHHVAAAVISGLDFTADPIFAWSILRAAFADTQYWRGKRWWEPDRLEIAKDRQRRRENAFRRGLADMRRRDVDPLPAPPPAFETSWRWRRSWRTPLVRGVRPYRVLFSWGRVQALLSAIPLKALAKEPRLANHLQEYLQEVVRWAKAYSEDPRDRHDNHYPFELMGQVGKLTGRLAALTAERSCGQEPWRGLTILEERDHGLELVGDFLEGMTRELIASGEAPSPSFWSVWDPAANWVLGPPERPPRRSRRSIRELSSPTAAAGFVGPYMTPIPPDWLYVSDLLPRIDNWAERMKGLASAADALLRFCDRLSAAQIRTYGLPWIERWLELHETDPEFWAYSDVVNRAAVVTLRVQAEAEADSDLQRRMRRILARLADQGSLAARQALAAVAAQRPTKDI